MNDLNNKAITDKDKEAKLQEFSNSKLIWFAIGFAAAIILVYIARFFANPI